MCGIELEELEIMGVGNDLIFQLVRWKSIFVIQLCNVSVEIYVICIFAKEQCLSPNTHLPVLDLFK